LARWHRDATQWPSGAQAPLTARNTGASAARARWSARPPRELVDERGHARHETQLVRERFAVQQHVDEVRAADAHGRLQRCHLLLDVDEAQLVRGKDDSDFRFAHDTAPPMNTSDRL
jgi:hypothetical protein